MYLNEIKDSYYITIVHANMISNIIGILLKSKWLYITILSLYHPYFITRHSAGFYLNLSNQKESKQA